MVTYQADGWTALGDPTRRAIFAHLAERPRPVGELAQELPVSRPAVSQHLRVLKEAGLVIDRPLGNRRIYSNGQSLGDPSSPVQLSSSIVGDRPIPTRAMPEVVARVGVDLDPLDVTDADHARWLRACLPPDQPERGARLEEAILLAATDPPLLLRGDAVEVLPDAFARVPPDALPVVTTTWALSRFSLESRLRFLHRLGDTAAGRAVAWVSARGSESRRRSRRSAIAAPLATAPSAWRCSTGQLCAPRPLAAAGRRAIGWRG